MAVERPGAQQWVPPEADVEPAVVVCLGATAARSVLGRDVAIGEVRGEVLGEPRTSGTAAHGPLVLVTTHPSALLRLRGKGGLEEAFDGLVADLRTAADAAR